jgi:hypothetical protein
MPTIIEASGAPAPSVSPAGGETITIAAPAASATAMTPRAAAMILNGMPRVRSRVSRERIKPNPLMASRPAREDDPLFCEPELKEEDDEPRSTRQGEVNQGEEGRSEVQSGARDEVDHGGDQDHEGGLRDHGARNRIAHKPDQATLSNRSLMNSADPDTMY